MIKKIDYDNPVHRLIIELWRDHLNAIDCGVKVRILDILASLLDYHFNVCDVDPVETVLQLLTVGVEFPDSAE